MAPALGAGLRRRQLTYVLELVVLTTVYVVAARFGFAFNLVSGFAALVWPATGISLAALLIFGYRLWPAVLLGAAIANVLFGAPLAVALSTGAGNALEALIGAYALRSVPGFRRALDRVSNVLALILLAGMASTTVSATVGVFALHLAGLVAADALGDTWRNWWLGDFNGVLVVAPLLLVWSTRIRHPLSARRISEAVVLGICIVAATAFIFARSPRTYSPLHSPYLLFTLLIWAAVRFGQRGVVAATPLIAALAVWATALGHGPFVQSAPYNGLLALQLFMAVTAATFLLLGAAFSEQQHVTAALEESLVEQKRLYEAVADANQAKTQFMAVMSHELRTPLNAIAGYVELIDAGIHGPVTPQQKADLARIRRSERRLLSVVNDILNFTKLDAGHLDYHFENIPLERILGTLDDLIRPQLEGKRLNYLLGDFDPHTLVRADSEKVEQILLNLLSNAIKFTPPGGSIHVSCDVFDDRIVMSVRDTGRGIAPEKLLRIFDPFVQVDRRLANPQDGVGLGLAISRALAHAMRGELSVQSAPGVGSTFSLSLPRAEDDRQ